MHIDQERIRRHLNKKTAEMIVHSFVTSRIDIGNALLYGITKSQIQRLQRLQNMAARVVTYTKSNAHITSVLIDSALVAYSTTD